MKSHSNRQDGGTILGLIIGLIIGLAIAVGVAVTIKNIPIPFSNKAVRPSKSPDPASGQLSDPNLPLYGNREAARQAARSAPLTAEEARVEALLQGQIPAPAPSASPVALAPSSMGGAMPQAVLPPAVTARPMAPPAGSLDERYTYFLQAGAFLQRSDAENTKAKLALMGVPANIAERRSDNGTLYRVRIGPFAQLEALQQVRGKLTDNDVDVAIVRVPR